jgi:hypothetical protein
MFHPLSVAEEVVVVEVVAVQVVEVAVEAEVEFPTPLVAPLCQVLVVLVLVMGGEVEMEEGGWQTHLHG